MELYEAVKYHFLKIVLTPKAFYNVAIYVPSDYIQKLW